MTAQAVVLEIILVVIVAAAAVAADSIVVEIVTTEDVSFIRTIPKRNTQALPDKTIDLWFSSNFST